MSGVRPTAIVSVLVLASLAGGVLEAQDAQRRRGFSITITQPVNQEIVFGKTKITAEVKIDDPELLDRVEFIVGDEVVFVDREPPWECFHDFGEESRSWVVRAIAHASPSSCASCPRRSMSFTSAWRTNHPN